MPAPSTTPLLDVEQAAARAQKAREDLVRAIWEARHAGLSLRAIAAASGLSHEQVRQVAK